MTRKISVAAAQYRPEVLVSLEDYEARIVRWVDEAVARGAEILVFPEYGSMDLASVNAPAGDLAQAIDAVTHLVPAIDRVHGALASKHGVTIVAGSFLQRTYKGIVNVAHIYGPSGAVGRYEKLMPTPWERDVAKVQCGHQLSVFDTGKLKIGLVICYDIEFPLISRALAEAGAEIILAPSNTETEWGYWRVRTGAVARALENQLYTVHCPTVGESPGIVACPVNIGAAGIFAPSDKGFPPGGVIALGEMNKPQWVHATLNLDLMQEVRRAGGVQTYRHWPEQWGAGALPRAQVIRISGKGTAFSGAQHAVAAKTA